MKGCSALTAVNVFVSLSLSGYAQAPQGSYLRTCTDIRIEGRTLVAIWRRADGRGQRTARDDVERCIGDIGNNNGVLRCHRGPARPGYPPPYRSPAPRYGEGHEYWEHCERPEHAQRELFGRLQYTPGRRGAGAARTPAP
jgi:hypothetical protein